MNNRDVYYSPITRDYSKASHAQAKQFRKDMTLAELRLWQALRANRLRNLRFRRQQPIMGFIADFYCHSCRLVIEVDGEVHDQTTQRDAERDKILVNAGMIILRFNNRQIYEGLESVLVHILQSIDEHHEAP